MLHLKVSKEDAAEMVDVLAVFHQNTVDSGKIRDQKIVNVTAVFKNRERQETINHRPVGLTSYFVQILKTVDKWSIAGLKKNHTTIILDLTNLLGFVEDVTNRVDKGEPVDVLYTVFQKALEEIET